MPAYVKARRPGRPDVTVVVKRIELQQINERRVVHVYGVDRGKGWSWASTYDLQGSKLSEHGLGNYAGPVGIFEGFTCAAIEGRVQPADKYHPSQKSVYDKKLRERVDMLSGTIEDLSPGDRQWFEDLGRDWGRL